MPCGGSIPALAAVYFIGSKYGLSLAFVNASATVLLTLSRIYFFPRFLFHFVVVRFMVGCNMFYSLLSDCRLKWCDLVASPQFSGSVPICFPLTSV